MNVTCFSSASEKAVVYAQIHKKIAALNDSIRALKVQHNLLNITARLPDELLQRIFLWNFSMQRESENNYWIQVAGVCTEWRRVALCCPQLWSIVRRCQRKRWITDVIIPRSREVPLYINASLNRRSSKRFNSVLDQMHRIRELSLVKYGSRDITQALLSSLTKAAAVLEYFQANMSGTADYVYRLPDDLFDNTAPKLGKLVLRNCLISSSSPLLSGLTILTLEYLYKPGGLTLSQLINLLRVARNVEELELSRACSFNSASSNLHVVLPHLKRLIIFEEGAKCALLLSCISCPTVTYIQVEPRLPPERGFEAVPDLEEELAACISPITRLSIINLTGTPRNTVLLHGKRGKGDDGTPTDLTLEIVMVDNNLETLESLIHILPLLHLECLEMQSWVLTSFLLKEFGHLPSLHTIDVKHRASALIRALIRDVSQQQMQDWLANIPDEWVQPSVLTRGIDEDRDKSSERDEALEQSVGLTGDDPEDGSDTSESESSCAEQFRIARRRTHFTHFKDETKFSVFTTPGASYFKALKTLKFNHCYFDDMDTTLLAVLLHVRYTRHSPLQELSVKQSTHSSLTADRDVASMRRSVSFFHWDVERLEDVN